MLITIGLDRVVLDLIVAFSFGLAAVLIAIGILRARSGSRLDRLGNREITGNGFYRSSVP